MDCCNKRHETIAVKMRSIVYKRKQKYSEKADYDYS